MDETADRRRIGEVSGVSALGLDALASAAYGPEAALAVLVALGPAGSAYLLPLMLGVIGLLVFVQGSYRQALRAYPDGGGSYTVARENLGNVAGLIAAAALFVDYILNVAVAITAGVEALVSAVPSLVGATVPLCLGLLALLALLNLRGVRNAGLALMAPTLIFVSLLGATIVLGVVKLLWAQGDPTPVVAPPPAPSGTALASGWLLAKAFAAGSSSLTGIEAVSNAVPEFRPPRVARAERTLTILGATLAFLLLGVAVLVRAFGLHGMPPGAPGYQSVLSQMVAAVAGRGVFYFLCMASILGVLGLSANTSFVDFPRLCRVLSRDGYLPRIFARASRRRARALGIVLLTLPAAALISAFRGSTDRLIPLFVIGAFTAFLLAHWGMVVHWARHRERRRFAIWSARFNAVGGTAVLGVLAVVAASRFFEGAWLAVVVMPVFVGLFTVSRRRLRGMAGG